MRFKEWVKRERGDKMSRTAFLSGFSKKTGVSLQTLQFVVKGGLMSLYPKAKAISDGTDGEVSIAELCE